MWTEHELAGLAWSEQAEYGLMAVFLVLEVLDAVAVVEMFEDVKFPA